MVIDNGNERISAGVSLAALQRRHAWNNCIILDGNDLLGNTRHLISGVYRTGTRKTWHSSNRTVYDVPLVFSFYPSDN